MTPSERYAQLKKHLSEENPILIDAIDHYRTLDSIAHRYGLLDEEESYTAHISWWPLISVLGTFSAGKSTFINHYLGRPVQQSGNQAVDDKFTVIAYGENDEVTTLPGMALDADPRFPFYNISNEIEEVEKGEGERVNLYLQLKTLRAEALKGKILIDSPGFDADSQRDTILRITSHIIDMSDLVLIFFDARHPEPGAMRDTLEHLVGTAVRHNDADKILYILNQIDTTSKEDNLEDVIGSWQRALASQGLVAGNTFAIYNESAASIEDDSLRERLERKMKTDLEAITHRMDKVSIERAYRILRQVENLARSLEHDRLPKLREQLVRWGRQVMIADTVLVSVLAAAAVFAEVQTGMFSAMLASPPVTAAALLGLLAGLTWMHFSLRRRLADRLRRRLQNEDPELARAVGKMTKWWRPVWSARSGNWAKTTFRTLENLTDKSRRSIQRLNDTFLRKAPAEPE